MASLAIPAAISGGSTLLNFLQGHSASNDAVKALLDSFTQAGTTASNYTGDVNKNIYGNADAWSHIMMDTGNNAAADAKGAADTGIAGVNDAVKSGQGMLQPYAAAGTKASDTLSSLLQNPNQFNFQADPGYNFRLQEGMKQINRSAAAHGAAGGGGTAKALAQYGSGLASQEYGNAWNRWNTQGQERQQGLQTLAGMGERAGEVSGSMGMAGSQFNAGLGENAAQYGGNARMGTTQAGSNLWSHSTDEMSQNSLDLGNFLANMQLQSGKTRAAGDINNSNLWSGLISSLTNVGLNLLKGKGPSSGGGDGFGPAGPPPPGTGGQY